MLVILARLTSPEMVGRFALGLAVAAPIIMLSNLQLRAVQATDAREEYQFCHYLGLRLITTTLALLMIVGIIFLGKYSLSAGSAILAIGFSKAFESISDVYYGYMQRHERLDCIAKSMLIKGPASLCSLGVVVYVTGDILWGVISLALTWALILILYDIPTAKKVFRCLVNDGLTPMNLQDGLRPNFNMSLILKIARLALPLGVVMCLVSLTPNIPRYFVEHYWGEKNLGIFAAIAYLVVAGNTLVGALGQSATPRLANYYAAGNYTKFRQLLLRMLSIGGAMGAVGVFTAAIAGRPLLEFFYGSEYATHIKLFIWLMVFGGVTFVASFCGYGMTAARYFRMQMPLFMLVACVTGGVSWILIPNLGIIGAAFSLLSGAVAQLIGSIFVIFHTLRHQRLIV